MAKSINALEQIVSYLRESLDSESIVARLAMAAFVTASLLLWVLPQAEARPSDGEICDCPPGLCHCFPGGPDDPLPRPYCYCEEPSIGPASIRPALPISITCRQHLQSSQAPKSGQVQSGAAAVP